MPGKKAPDKTSARKNFPRKNGPRKMVPRKKVSARSFPTSWCMWERVVSIRYLLLCVESSGGINGWGSNLKRRNVERPLFQNFEIANIKITKDELFDSFIFELINLFLIFIGDSGEF